MTIGSGASSGLARMRRQISKPSAPGSMTSRTITSNRPRRSAARPRSPSAATVTSISCLPRYSVTRRASLASSSTRSAVVRDGIVATVSVAHGVHGEAMRPDPVGDHLPLVMRERVVHLDDRLRDRGTYLVVLRLVRGVERVELRLVDGVGLEQRERFVHVRGAILP